jgi:hypothetical protein
MSDVVPESEHSWDVGWDGHERAQQRRFAQLPLWKKLQWLEEMNRIIRHLRSQDKRSPIPSEAPPAAPADTTRHCENEQK